MKIDETQKQNKKQKNPSVKGIDSDIYPFTSRY